LGNQDAAEEEKGGQAQVAEVKCPEVVAVLPGKEMGMGFHHHEGGQEADKAEVIQAAVLNMLAEGLSGI